MKINWQPPKDWQQISTIEAHTAGEPLRVIIDGIPEIPGKTILEKRRFVHDKLDHIRTGLMWEPRGHADMYGAIMTEPVTPDGDIGVLFMHNEGYSTMCGHGVIALAKVVLDTGIIEKSGNNPVIKMDTPAGRVTATAHRQNGVVQTVSFLNVPSYVYKSNQTIDVEGIGTVKYDIAFGGAFYAFCKVDKMDVDIWAKDFTKLIHIGRQIKYAVMDKVKINHPFEQDMGFLYGTILIGNPLENSNHSRNVCIFAEGEVDRSPTGTGVSARAAIHYFKNEIGIGQPITIESILGTCFDVEVVEKTKFGDFNAIIPKVTGTASIIGQNNFYFDPIDPLRKGFIFR